MKDTSIVRLILDVNNLKHLTASKFYKTTSGRITSLRLTEMTNRYWKFTGDTLFLPNEIGNLDALERISFFHNKNISHFPVSLKKLKKLKYLGLYGNSLKEIPKSVFDLDSLRYLDLRSNCITNISPEISKLKNLDTLWLSSNKLENLPFEISKLKELKVLNISSNNFNHIPKSIFMLHNLEKLNLQSNEIFKIPEMISSLIKLKTLELGSNNIEILPDELCKLENLEQLHLGANRIKKLPDNLGDLQQLKSLSASANELSLLPQSLLDHDSLKHINVYRNKLCKLTNKFKDWINSFPRTKKWEKSQNCNYRPVSVGGELIKNGIISYTFSWDSDTGFKYCDTCGYEGYDIELRPTKYVAFKKQIKNEYYKNIDSLFYDNNYLRFLCISSNEAIIDSFYIDDNRDTLYFIQPKNRKCSGNYRQRKFNTKYKDSISINENITWKNYFINQSWLFMTNDGKHYGNLSIIGCDTTVIELKDGQIHPESLVKRHGNSLKLDYNPKNIRVNILVQSRPYSMKGLSKKLTMW